MTTSSIRWLCMVLIVRLAVIVMIVFPIMFVIVFTSSVTPPSVQDVPSMEVQLVIQDTNEHDSDIDTNIVMESEETNVSEYTAQGYLRKPDFYTFLIFGVDKLGGNTDTIMVASFDTANLEAHIVSIPRDLKVVTARTGLPKINAAYSDVKRKSSHTEGVEALRSDVSTLIGFTPDYYITVNLEAFIRLIDVIGGVEVDVKQNMYYEDPGQGLFIDLKKGLQTLSGKDALGYARYRTGSEYTRGITDYERISNQQSVMRSVFEGILRVENFVKIPELVDIFISTVETDLSVGNILWFASKVKDVKNTDGLHMHTLPIGMEVASPVFYSFASSDMTVELINKTINPYTEDISDESFIFAYR